MKTHSIGGIRASQHHCLSLFASFTGAHAAADDFLVSVYEALIAEGTQALAQASEAWADYVHEQGVEEQDVLALKGASTDSIE